jgi:hypothetical protein
MKLVGNILAYTLLALGVLWVGQGFGLIPSTFIEIRFNWDMRGWVALGLGMFLLFIINFEGQRRK